MKLLVLLVLLVSLTDGSCALLNLLTTRASIDSSISVRVIESKLSREAAPRRDLQSWHDSVLRTSTPSWMHSGFTVFLNDQQLSSHLPFGRATSSHMWNPSVRLLQAETALLSSHLRKCEHIEDGYSFFADWLRLRIPLLQWMTLRFVPQELRYIMPQVTLMNALSHMDPWNLVVAAFKAAPLRTTNFLMQLGWLLFLRQCERDCRTVLPQMLGSLALVLESLATFTL